MPVLVSASDGLLLGFVFDPEDRDDRFLQNSVPPPNYITLQTRKQYSVYILLYCIVMIVATEKCCS
jgi:hypothetical protein